MILARIFSNIYKEGGIILIDAKGQKYICGNPKKDNPITVKAGDLVLYGKYSGNELNYNGIDYLIMKEADILAVIG